MLNELEGKLVSVVADVLASRAGVTVIEAAGPLAPPAVGAGVVRAGLTSVEPDGGFAASALAPVNGGPPQRRVLPLRFEALVEGIRRPADATAAALSASRRLLLEDLSLVGYALAADGVRAGAAFASDAPDPGFEVRGFELDGGSVDVEPADGLLRGQLSYAGHAVIWPPGTPAEEGEIAAVDPFVAALPLTIAPDSAVVATGGTTSVRIRGLAGDRLADPATGARTPQRLAVGVVSDLPPADRGQVTSGSAASDAGFRLVALDQPETVVAYQAPAGPLGAVRIEHVAVHLATTSGGRGPLLGSTIVLLREAAP